MPAFGIIAKDKQNDISQWHRLLSYENLLQGPSSAVLLAFPTMVFRASAVLVKAPLSDCFNT